MNIYTCNIDDPFHVIVQFMLIHVYKLRVTRNVIVHVYCVVQVIKS